MIFEVTAFAIKVTIEPFEVILSLNGVRNVFFGVIMVIVDLIILRFEVNRRIQNGNGGRWGVWGIKGKGGADASTPPRCPPQSNTAIPN